MTAFVPVIINDGHLTTPVAHTFTPRRIADGIAKWQDKSGGIAVGFPTITASLREPVSGSRNPVYKAVIKIDVPVLETISNSTVSGILPAPTKGYAPTVNIEFLLHERSNAQDRNHILAYTRNLLNHPDIIAMIKDLDFVY